MKSITFKRLISEHQIVNKTSLNGHVKHSIDTSGVGQMRGKQIVTSPNPGVEIFSRNLLEKPH